jgi:uncharacterized alpha-E superfamily protein
VLQLLLVDESNPRSVAFQLATLLHQIDRLQENDGEGEKGVERLVALGALTALRECLISDLSKRVDGRFPALDGLIEQVQSSLYELSEALTARYLSHLAASRQTAYW